jgi:hypothetical protein
MGSGVTSSYQVTNDLLRFRYSAGILDTFLAEIGRKRKVLPADCLDKNYAQAGATEETEFASLQVFHFFLSGAAIDQTSFSGCSGLNVKYQVMNFRDTCAS